MSISTEKKEVVKKFIKLHQGKRNIYSKIFNILKKEITEMFDDGLSIPTIAEVISIELDTKINQSTLKSWIYRHIKTHKRKGSNNVKKDATKEAEEKSETSLAELSKKFDVFKK